MRLGHVPCKGPASKRCQKRAGSHVHPATSHHSVISQPYLIPSLAVCTRQVVAAQELLAGSVSHRRRRTPTVACAASVQLESKTIRYVIVAPKETAMGQSLKVVGSVAELGNWDASAAPVMEWREGHLWTLDAMLPKEPFEFKLIMVSGAQVIWEQGSNRVMQGTAVESAHVEVACTFDSPGNMAVMTIKQEQEAADSSDTPALAEAAVVEEEAAAAEAPGASSDSNAASEGTKVEEMADAVPSAVAGAATEAETAVTADVTAEAASPAATDVAPASAAAQGIAVAVALGTMIYFGVVQFPHFSHLIS